jgi:glycosyltransferase involved in cell wall biosynthesis
MQAPRTSGSAPATSRWCIIGPTHPFRGGIPRHTTLFTDALAGSGLDVTFLSFTRQYPRWLYKGASDRDPDQLRTTRVEADHELDTVAPWTWRRVARRIDELAPDVLLVVWWHPFFAPMTASLLGHARRHLPDTVRLALCHNVLPHETSPIDRVFSRAALSRADGVVVHAASQERLARDLLRDTPTLVSPHPTYTVDTPAGDAAGRGDGPLTLLFFGLIRPYKGLHVLLRAMPAALKERSLRLVVAGEFWDTPNAYMRLVRELGIDEHVEVRPGYVPDDELVELLAAADLVVAPYRSATQSGTIEMALGAGVPVIASDVGGLADQVRAGVNGLVVPAGDPEALAAAIVDATEPALLTTLTEGARAPATIRTWESLAADVTAFASDLRTAGRPRNGPPTSSPKGA